MTKRAYEELKVANREALTVSRGDYGDNRESLYAMNAAHSSDMQSVFGNLLQSVLSTRNNSSSLVSRFPTQS